VASAGESVVFDRAAGYYDATRGFPLGVEDRVAELFARAGGLGPASRVLEIGVGTGRIALPLAPRVSAYVGADLSVPMLEKLVAKRGALPIRLVRADAPRLPFVAASFEAVVAVHVFHLIAGWREALADAARVLRPGGLLLHGADDHSRGGAWRRWRDRFAETTGVRNVGVPAERFETFPEEEGWQPAGVHRLDFSRRVRPRDLLDLVAARCWSSTWRLGEEELAAAGEALRRELLAEFSDLDRQVEIEAGFWVRAYRPPAG
jgi:SAM-dependent methyltransferase